VLGVVFSSYRVCLEKVQVPPDTEDSSMIRTLIPALGKTPTMTTVNIMTADSFRSAVVAHRLLKWYSLLEAKDIAAVSYLNRHGTRDYSIYYGR
jgi:hypothetical protein